MESYCYMLGKPRVTACFRERCEDFIVDEVLGFEPDGTGEHCVVQIRKTDTNTAFVARRLARVAGVKERDVSFCGLKDRRAITTQWFSVHLPGKSVVSLDGLESDEIRVVHQSRHTRKLRRGTHVGNRFTITLRNLEGDVSSVDARLKSISDAGFPNYFGEQRFGFNGQNVDRARELFSKPSGKSGKRNNTDGLYISAARSTLFNQVLSERLRNGSYDQIVPGDVMVLDGSRSVFPVDNPDEELEERFRTGDIHISGPLWGGGKVMTSFDRHNWEASCLGSHQDLCDGLVARGLKHERRALRAFPTDLSWHWIDDKSLQISFYLSSGGYATSLLREVAVLATPCHDTRR